MKIQKSEQFNDLHFEEEKYVSFLREHGVSEEDIDDLNIFFVDGHESEQVARILDKSIAAYTPIGLYMAPLRTFDTEQLNFTFLHETRHFLQEVTMAFVNRDDLPYDEQPQEIDADEFAETCIEEGISFIGPDDIVERLQKQYPNLFDEWVSVLAAMPLRLE